jgi:hypothetical protein
LKLPYCDRAPRSLRSLQKYPLFAHRPSKRLGTLQCSPRAPAAGGPAKLRRTGGRDRPGAGRGRLEGSLGSIPTGVWGGGGAGGVAVGAKEWAARGALRWSRERLGGLSRDGWGAVWSSARPGQGRRGGAAWCGRGVACALWWPASLYVGVARQKGIVRTGGRTRAADHGTWRDNFDAPRCGCGLGRRGASGRCGLGMARPREVARGLGRRGLVRRKARGRRRGARARIPASINSSYPCLTEFISKFLN